MVGTPPAVPNLWVSPLLSVIYLWDMVMVMSMVMVMIMSMVVDKNMVKWYGIRHENY